MPNLNSAGCTYWYVAGAALSIPLLFATFTHHAWEDFYITLRSSRNFVEGHGLVFNPGEKLHTFTSPLGVLLPAIGLWATGGNDSATLWLFRIASAGALAIAFVALWHRSRSLGLSSFTRSFLIGFLLLDAKLTDFAINGQETAFLVSFAVLLWSELERPEGARSLPLAFAYSGLMWTRPDAFILAGALTAPHLWASVRDHSSQPRNQIFKGVSLGGLLYAPWFAWAWIYYGSPVPQTIVAKGAMTNSASLTSIIRVPWDVIRGATRFDSIFLPTNMHFGGWPAGLRDIALGLCLAATFAWLVPAIAPAGRRASIALFVGMLYLSSILIAAWYLPPWTALGAISLAFGIEALMTQSKRNGFGWLASLTRVAATTLLCVQAGVLAASAWEMRCQQHLVEDQGRRSIGLWLHDHAQPTDTVFLEPLGYIGYFSNLKTYDYPGLSSVEIVKLIKSGRRHYRNFIEQLQPTWLVLRPAEIAYYELGDSDHISGYHAVQEWDATQSLETISFLPGRRWLEFDSKFVLFRKDAAAKNAVSSKPQD